MNMFRIHNPGEPNHGKLDKQYLRTCAVYKLCKQGKIDKARAIDLLAQRGTSSNVAELWFKSSICDFPTTV